MSQRFFRFFGLVLVALALSGCAAKEAPIRMFWPAPPDEPRLEWQGVYSSEKDFPQTGFQRTLTSLTGDPGQFIFKSPVDLVSDGKGRVYISDIHGHNIRVYDFNTGKAFMLLKEPVLRTPTGMSIDSKGNLYVVDGEQRRIFVLSPEGQIVRTIGSSKEFGRPAYPLVVEKRNRLYVSDGLEGRIVVFDLAGNHLFTFAEKGGNDGQLLAPGGLAVDSEGRIFVADMLNARIQVFDAEGGFVKQFGVRGDQFYQFENPKDLAFDSDGNLHIVDARKGLLLSYSPDGELLMVTGGGGASTTHAFGFTSPKGIYIDNNDLIMVSDQLNKRFTVFQYLSKAHLAKNPISPEDLKRTEQYIKEQVARKKAEDSKKGIKK